MKDRLRVHYEHTGTLSFYNISLCDHIKNRKEKESVFINRLARIIAQSPHQFEKQDVKPDNDYPAIHTCS